MSRLFALPIFIQVHFLHLTLDTKVQKHISYISPKGDSMMSSLKELRISKKLTQKEASSLVGVSLRSYKDYENDVTKENTPKYRFMMQEIEKHITLDEEHGILTVKEIENACRKVFDEYEVKYCILFGSYAKGKANEKSDVDLLISTETTGLRFYGLAERLRNELKKQVDLLDSRQLLNNLALIDEIMEDGVKIYGQHKG